MVLMHMSKSGLYRNTLNGLQSQRQALMNHIFGEYIGTFMDIYLDDIVIYSDTE